MDAISILVLEDDPAHAEAIRRAFESADPPAEIRMASSVREYCGLVADRPPDIAILDLNLPDGSAMEGLVPIAVRRVAVIPPARGARMLPG